MGLTKPRAAQIYNLDYKQATRVVAVTTITLAGGAPSSVDGVSLSINDRVLVTAQSTNSQNGIYLVTTVGSGSNGTWARTSDANDTGEIEAGMIVMVTEGSVYADTQWKLITNDPITIGTTALTFTQNYSANSITGGTSNVTVYSNANVTISSAGTANVLTVSSTGIVVAGTTSVTGNIIPTANATYSLGSATNYFKSLYVAGNSIYLGNVTLGTTSGILTVNSSNVVTADAGGNTSTTGNITGGNILTGGLISATGNITGNYIIGNGSQLTGLAATYGNSNVTTLLAAFGSNTISTSGTVNSGNITGSNLLTSGLVSASGTITGTSHIGLVVSVTGAVTAASVVGGVMTGLSTSVTGTLSGASASVSGGVTAASVSGGVITGTSTSVTGSQTAASTVGGVITGTSTSVTGTATAASTVGGIITGSSASVTGAVTGSSLVGTITTASQTNITSVGTLSSLSVTGNVTGGVSTYVVLQNTINSTTQNTGALQVQGGASINKDLWVAGNIYAGNIVGYTANVITVEDPLLYLQPNGNVTFPYNYDIGVYSAFTGGAGNTYQHTGIIRDFNDGVWKLASNLAEPAGTTLTFDANTIYDAFKSGAITSTSTISATGNITGGNVSATNHTGTNVSVTGAVTAASVAGGVITGTSTSVTGSQTAASTVGGVITGTSTSVTGTQTAASTVGGVITGTSLSASGTIIGANNLVITSPSPQLEGGQIVLAWANISGISGQSNSTWNLDVDPTNNFRIFSQNAAGQANVSATFSPLNGNITIAGNINPGAIYTNGYYYANGTAFSGGGGGTPGGANTQIQFNDGSTFGGSAGLTFNKTTNALATTGTVSASGTITGTSHLGAVVSVTGAVTAASTVGGVITGTSVSVSGNVTALNHFGTNTSVTGTQTAASTVGGVITGTSVSVTTGTITGGNIVNGNGNGVGNIGSSTTYFNTVFAKATSAQYADLAEMYASDDIYPSGTVVEFGGNAEITSTTSSHSTQVAGIISTNPSYLMNSGIDCKYPLELALTGRVPCRVVGTVRKGDRLVSSDISGVAQSLDINLYQPGCIIGKALEEYDSTDPGVIEVAVGRF